MSRRDSDLAIARRVDWRFLLADPAPARVALVGPPDEALREALRMFCGEPVCWSAPPDEAPALFDLVVATSPRQEHVRQAARFVAEGGTLRWESRGTPRARAIRDTLRACHLDDVRVHWHRPRFEESLEAIPLDSRGVVDHVLGSGTHGVAGEWRRAGARLLRAAGLFDVVTSCRAGSGRRGVARGGGLPERLREASARRTGGRAQDVTLLLRTPRFRASGHALLFAFPENATVPDLVAKISRLPGPAASLAREAASLEWLAETPGGVVGVPHLVERTAAAASEVIIETIVPGKNVHPALVRRSSGRVVETFSLWIQDLHRRTRVYAITNGWWQEIVEQPLQRIEAFFGPGSREAKLASRTREIASPFRDAATSWVLEHGDLSAPNLLLDADRPGVVDWELGTNHGLPGGDLFFFLGFVATTRSGARSPGAVRGALRSAFFGPDPWAAPSVQRYARVVGIPSHELPALYVLAWARNVASYLERLADDDVGPNDAQRSNDDVRSWLRGERCWTAWCDAVENFDELNPDGIGRRAS